MHGTIFFSVQGNTYVDTDWSDSNSFDSESNLSGGKKQTKCRNCDENDSHGFCYKNCAVFALVLAIQMHFHVWFLYAHHLYSGSSSACSVCMLQSIVRKTGNLEHQIKIHSAKERRAKKNPNTETTTRDPKWLFRDVRIEILHASLSLSCWSSSGQAAKVWSVVNLDDCTFVRNKTIRFWCNKRTQSHTRN